MFYNVHFFIFEHQISFMKNIFFLSVFIVAFSCNKNNHSQTDSTKIIDSINAARTKINDSIRNRNHFENMTGTHIFTHNGISEKGTVIFKKVKDNNDEYEISGEIKSGKNYAKINGLGIRVSPKHFNFTGEITQSIQDYDNGKIYIRKGTKTFLSKDGGKSWRLQDMVNSSGFADYIDIR